MHEKVRRPEFKKARKAKWRGRQRTSLARVLRDSWRGISEALHAQINAQIVGLTEQNPVSDSPTTLATDSVAPVNYGEAARYVNGLPCS